MTKHINIDKSKSPCDSSNHQMPDSCVLEMLTEDLGCNLPWKSTANANYKVCNQTEEFVNYSTLITSEDFKKKIEKCEIPNCHTKQYNSHDFSDKYEDNTNTTGSF